MEASWEEDVLPQVWEDDDNDDVDDLDDESDNEWEPQPPTAGQSLVDHLLNLYMRRRLLVEDVCIAMHYASAQFAEVKPYAKPPGLTSGKYNEHLKVQLG